MNSITRRQRWHLPVMLPACLRPGFKWTARETRATWSIAATLASAALISASVYLTADSCRPWTTLYMLDNGLVVFC